MLRTGLIFVALATTDFHIEPKGSEAMKLSLKPNLGALKKAIGAWFPQLNTEEPTAESEPTAEAKPTAGPESPAAAPSKALKLNPMTPPSLPEPASDSRAVQRALEAAAEKKRAQLGADAAAAVEKGDVKWESWEMRTEKWDRYSKNIATKIERQYRISKSSLSVDQKGRYDQNGNFENEFRSSGITDRVDIVSELKQEFPRLSLDNAVVIFNGGNKFRQCINAKYELGAFDSTAGICEGSRTVRRIVKDRLRDGI